MCPRPLNETQLTKQSVVVGRRNRSATLRRERARSRRFERSYPPGSSAFFCWSLVIQLVQVTNHKGQVTSVYIRSTT